MYVARGQRDASIDFEIIESVLELQDRHCLLELRWSKGMREDTMFSSVLPDEHLKAV